MPGWPQGRDEKGVGTSPETAGGRRYRSGNEAQDAAGKALAAARRLARVADNAIVNGDVHPSPDRALRDPSRFGAGKGEGARRYESWP